VFCTIIMKLNISVMLMKDLPRKLQGTPLVVVEVVVVAVAVTVLLW